MIDVRRINELLGEVKEPTTEENERNIEGIANLANNVFLRRLLDLSMKSKLLDSVSFLAERKFEESFAMLESINVLLEIVTQLELAKESMEGSRGESVIKQDNSVKY